MVQYDVDRDPGVGDAKVGKYHVLNGSKSLQ